MEPIIKDKYNDPLQIGTFYSDKSGQTLLIVNITENELITDYFSAKVHSPIKMALKKARDFSPLSEIEIKDEIEIDRDHANWLEKNLTT